MTNRPIVALPHPKVKFKRNSQVTALRRSYIPYHLKPDPEDSNSAVPGQVFDARSASRTCLSGDVSAESMGACTTG